MGLFQRIRRFLLMEPARIDVEHHAARLLILQGVFRIERKDLFEAVFRPLLQEDQRGVVVDVSSATFLGNGIMGELVRWLVHLRARNVRIAFVAAPAGARNTDWLRVTKLDRVFATFEDRVRALEEVSRDRDP